MSASAARARRSQERLSVRLLRVLAMGLRMAGGDPDAVLRRAGIDPAVTADPVACVPLPAALECWCHVEEMLPHFGLRLAEALDFGLLLHVEAISDYMFAQLLVASATVESALQHAERYGAVTFGCFAFRLKRDSAGITVRFAGSDAATLPREFVNLAVGFAMRAALQTTSRKVVPAAVFFPYPKPRDLTTHERVFCNAPLEFGATSAGFRIAARDLGVRLLGANATLVERLRASGDAFLADRERLGPFATEVRALAASALRKGDASVLVVSRRAGMSRRMLARRLEKHGTSYRALIDEVRIERARELLLEQDRSIAQIAAAIGFANASAFQRAFRRRCGLSPGAFRESPGPPGYRAGDRPAERIESSPAPGMR